MEITKISAVLGRIGIVLLVTALILDVVFDIATKGILSALSADKIIWLIFGYFLGSELAGRKKYGRDSR